MAARTQGLSHERLWAAIDAIAEGIGLSTSALARRAGLDPSALARSKRTTADGRPRWPSTESIAKILDAAGVDLAELVRLILAPIDGRPCRSPLFGAVHGGGGGFAEGGSGALRGMAPPEPGPDGLFAHEIGDATAAPLYRVGDVVLASTAATVRKGDRVLVATADGAIAVHVFRRRDGRHVELDTATASLTPLRLADAEVLWIARILWASQ